MFADALRGFWHIVADEGTAEAILGAVRAGSMDGAAIEKQGITCLHDAGNRLLAFGRRHKMRVKVALISSTSAAEIGCRRRHIRAVGTRPSFPLGQRN